MRGEEELIKLAKSGDSCAFGELVQANQTKVYNLALKTVRNEQDALDLSQDAFLKAYTNISSFRGDCKFSVWLYRLTYNICIDFLRKKKRESENIIAFAQEDGGISCCDIQDERPQPEALAVNAELRAAIRAGMALLSPEHREILVLREVTGMSYAEISQTVGLSEGTVKSRISRARKCLADILLKSGTFSDGFRQKDREEAALHDKL